MELIKVAITYEEVSALVEVWEDLSYTLHYDRTHSDDQSFEHTMDAFEACDESLGKALKEWDQWHGCAYVGGWIYEAETYTCVHDGVAQKRYSVTRHDSEWAGSSNSA